MPANAGGVRAGRAFVELYLRDRVTKQLDRVERRMRAFGQSMRRIGQSLLIGGAAISAVFGFSLHTLSEFEDRMSAVAAKTGATVSELQRLRDVAKQLGSSTSFSAVEVAGAEEFLAQAGRNASQIPTDLPVMLDVARAGGDELTLPVAADIVTNVAGGFQIPDELQRVGDVMAAIAADANASILQMGQTFSDAAPVATLAGQSLEETAAAVGILGNSGVQATKAGTDVKNLLSVIAKNATIAGVATRDAAGNVRPLLDVMRELGPALADMSQAERTAFVIDTFGKFSARAAGILMNANDQIDRLRDVARNARGEAARMARTMDDNIGGSIRGLTSAFEGLRIEIGEAIGPAARAMIDDAAGAVRSLSGWVKANHELVTAVALAGGGVALLGAGMLAVSVPIGLAAFSLAKLSTAWRMLMSPLAAGVGVLSKVGGLFGFVSGGLKTAATAARGGYAAFRSLFRLTALRGVLGSLTGGLGLFGRGALTTAGLITGPLLSAFGLAAKMFSGVLGDLGGLGLGLARITRSIGLLAAGGGLRLAGRGVFTLGVNAAFLAKTIRTLSFASLTGGLKSLAGLLSGGVVSGLTAAGSAIAGLMTVAVSPTLLLAGAAAGVGAALVHAAGGFGSVIDGASGLYTRGAAALDRTRQKAGQAFDSIRTNGLRAWSAIVERLQSGDLAGAFRIGTAALRLVWSETVNAMSELWAPFVVNMRSGWSDSVTLLSDAWSGFVDLFGDLGKTLRGYWSDFVDYVGINTGAEPTKTSWNDVIAWLSGQFIRLQFLGYTLWESLKFNAADAAAGIRSTWHTLTNDIAGWIVGIPGVASALGADVDEIREQLSQMGSLQSSVDSRSRADLQTDFEDRIASLVEQEASLLQSLDEARKARNEQRAAEVEAEIAAAQEARDTAAVDLQANLEAFDIPGVTLDAKLAGLQERRRDLLLNKSTNEARPELAALDRQIAKLEQIAAGTFTPEIVDKATGMTVSQLLDEIEQAGTGRFFNVQTGQFETFGATAGGTVSDIDKRRAAMEGMVGKAHHGTELLSGRLSSAAVLGSGEAYSRIVQAMSQQSQPQDKQIDEQKKTNTLLEDQIDATNEVRQAVEDNVVEVIE